MNNKTLIPRQEKKLQEVILPQARDFGRSVAYELFASMLNPKYRGSGFQWKEFPALAKRFAISGVLLSFSEEEANPWNAEIKEAAGKSAEYAARQLLNESDLLTWWPNPERKTNDT